MKLKIQKFNPLEDAAPYYVEGEVEWHDGICALDAVYLFHTQLEPIHFDYACGGRVCGRCAVMIDGRPQMLCTTKLDDTEHVIEPLEGFPIMRDIVVDKTSFDDCITAISQRIMLEPVNKETFAPKDYVFDLDTQHLLEDGERCCRCGMCNVVCPALKDKPDEFVGPAQMFAVGFRYFDWYDQADRVAQAVSAGLYHCIQCGACSDACVLQLPHLKMWELLRSATVERDLVPSYAK